VQSYKPPKEKLPNKLQTLPLSPHAKDNAKPAMLKMNKYARKQQRTETSPSMETSKFKKLYVKVPLKLNKKFLKVTASNLLLAPPSINQVEVDLLQEVVLSVYLLVLDQVHAQHDELCGMWFHSKTSLIIKLYFHKNIIHNNF
jgi:hypothetical protein